MKFSFLRYFWALKVIKFDTKMYLNFSNLRGWTSAGRGQALVQKRGQVSDGGIGKIFTRWGDLPVPPRKKTLDSQTGCQIDDFENNMPCGLLKITGKCIVWECKAKFTCEEIHPNSFDRLRRAHVAVYQCGYSKWEHLEGMDSISG